MASALNLKGAARKGTQPLQPYHRNGNKSTSMKCQRILSFKIFEKILGHLFWYDVSKPN
jgi:hypothetical protein